MTLYADFSPQTVDVEMNSQSVSADMRNAERIPTPGRQGDPGFSPIVTVTNITGGHRVTITDEDGDHTFDVMDGADGHDGQTGRTPEIFATATTLPAGSDATANISGTIEQPLLTIGVPRGADGQNGQDGQNGRDGQDGQDGVSPTVSVTEITGGHSVSVTDKNGTQTFSVMDGEQGAPGTTDYTQLQNLPTINGTQLVTNVDTPNNKVEQTETTTSGYSNWRSVLISYGSVGTWNGSIATQTNTVRHFNNLRYQPSTGTLRTSIFYGNLTGTASGNLKGGDNVSSLSNDAGYLTLATLPIWDGGVT